MVFTNKTKIDVMMMYSVSINCRQCSCLSLLRISYVRLGSNEGKITNLVVYLFPFSDVLDLLKSFLSGVLAIFMQCLFLGTLLYFAFGIKASPDAFLSLNN